MEKHGRSTHIFAISSLIFQCLKTETSCDFEPEGLVFEYMNLKPPHEAMNRIIDTDKPIGNIEENEGLHELKAVPIFRNNDLYAELFPEIQPAFEKGEDPTLKKVFATIALYRGKNVILDKTCSTAITKPNRAEISLNDFPSELELNEVPAHPQNEKRMDRQKIFDLFKEKMNITILCDKDAFPETIDKKITEVLGGTFSPELVVSLFEIAKQKNNDIKNVYILTENIDDHIYTADRDQVLPTVVPTLVEGAKIAFGVDAVILPTINASDIKDGDLIVTDRHNKIIRDGAVAQKPSQFSVLPLETEISNNERYLENKPEQSKLITILRREFEIKS